MNDRVQYDTEISEEESYHAVPASTRPVRLHGDDHLTRFSRQALDSIVDQIADKYVWINYEHLTFLPPLGRWTRGDLHEAEDGEVDLHVFGRSIPLHEVDSDPRLLESLSTLPSSDAPSLSVTTAFSRRNFTRDVATEIVEDFDGRATPLERYAAPHLLSIYLLFQSFGVQCASLGPFLINLARR